MSVFFSGIRLYQWPEFLLLSNSLEADNKHLRYPNHMITKFKTMSSMACAASLALVALGLSTAQVRAITDGQSDGDNHPYVGLVAFFDGNGNYLWRCSGTLLSPAVFLTAGHCTGIDAHTGVTPATARVYFESDVRGLGAPFAGGVTGIPIPHPFWNGGLHEAGVFGGNSWDIGVVILDENVVMAEYGQLPGLGTLDALAQQRGLQNTTFDVVGYGVQYIRQNPFGLIKLKADALRYQGVVSLINLENALADGYNIMMTSDEGSGNGSGGIAFGDSGGPVFLPGTRNVVGISSFVLNAQAVGPGFAYRMDIPETQEFIYNIFEEHDPENNPFDNE